MTHAILESQSGVNMDVKCWPNFHRTKMCLSPFVVVIIVVVVLSICQCVLTADDNVRQLLSADTGDDQCSLETRSNYTGHCHCSSLLDIHCVGLDQIPRFVSNNRIFSAINMADQVISEVPQSAVDGLKVSVTYYIVVILTVSPSCMHGL